MWPKFNGRPRLFQALDARAALPQNCSIGKVSPRWKLENGTDGLKPYHQRAISCKSSFFNAMPSFDKANSNLQRELDCPPHYLRDSAPQESPAVAREPAPQASHA